MKKMTIILKLTLATLTTLSVNGQQLIKCDMAESYWAFEKDNSFFTVKLLGNVSEQERKSVVAVDANVLQYVIINKKDYINADSGTSDLEVLTNYVLSEAKYMSGLFKQKLNIQMQKSPLFSDKTVLIWFFEMPSSVSQEVKHQVFANVVIGDEIFGLSSSQFIGQKLEDVKSFLMDVISTLKKVDSKRDFYKLCGQ